MEHYRLSRLHADDDALVAASRHETLNTLTPITPLDFEQWQQTPGDIDDFIFYSEDPCDSER